jgi:hypothetical protein
VAKKNDIEVPPGFEHVPRGRDIIWVHLSNCEHGRSKCPNYWAKLIFYDLRWADFVMLERHASKNLDFLGFPGNSFRDAPISYLELAIQLVVVFFSSAIAGIILYLNQVRNMLGQVSHNAIVGVVHSIRPER